MARNELFIDIILEKQDSRVLVYYPQLKYKSINHMINLPYPVRVYVPLAELLTGLLLHVVGLHQHLFPHFRGNVFEHARPMVAEHPVAQGMGSVQKKLWLIGSMQYQSPAS